VDSQPACLKASNSAVSDGLQPADPVPPIDVTAKWSAINGCKRLWGVIRACDRQRRSFDVAATGHVGLSIASAARRCWLAAPWGRPVTIHPPMPGFRHPAERHASRPLGVQARTGRHRKANRASFGERRSSTFSRSAYGQGSHLLLPTWFR
jgi:hypothetical protein